LTRTANLVNQSKEDFIKRIGDQGNQARADRILDAAARLIAHYGYDKTTVDDIARDAGVYKGAIYPHWRSKDDLFEALIFREGERVLDVMLQNMEADPDGGTLLSLYRHSLLALADNPLMYALYVRDTRVLGDYVRRQPDVIAQRHAFNLMFVRRMQEVGMVRSDFSAEVISHLLSIFAYGALTIDKVLPPGDYPSLQEVTEALVSLLPEALTPKDGGNAAGGKQVIEEFIETIRQVLRQQRESSSS